MDATTLSNSQSLNNFLLRIKQDYPRYGFKPGKQDHWSPGKQIITYNPDKPLAESSVALLHELAHAELNHTTYTSDLELLKLESQAWKLAAKIGKQYEVIITNDHIQNCLDTYRDWLHQRSACPNCTMRVLQTNPSKYECFNCHTEWAVTADRFSRSYRKTKIAQ